MKREFSFVVLLLVTIAFPLGPGACRSGVQLDEIASPRTVDEGRVLQFTVSASGQNVTLTAQNLPENATFTDNGDGTGVFRFEPDHTQAYGSPYTVRFIATDGKDTDTQSVVILVNDDPSLDFFALSGTIVTPDTVIYGGEILFGAEGILCVGNDCSTHSHYAEATKIDTDGFIFPGLIDAHNHVGYNFLEFCDLGRTYDNRYQWQNDPTYDECVAPYRENKSELICEMTKYGEIKALIAGTTSIQGSASGDCTETLIRNIEHREANGFSDDVIQTRVTSIASMSASTARSIANNIEEGTTKAFVAHVSEGRDTSSLDEYFILRDDKDLLLDATAIIHGVPYGLAQFAEMARIGVSLIWSPRSNLVLYGQTADIRTAFNQHVNIALAPDWSPSGSRNILDELKCADDLNGSEFSGILGDEDLVDMVTKNAAESLGMPERIGRLAVGYEADITVIAGSGSPYAALVGAEVEDVRLVFLAGRPLYGDDAIMRGALRFTDPQDWCEPLDVCGVEKRICVKSSATSSDKFNQTLGDIESILETMYNDYGKSIDPLFTCSAPPVCRSL
ncbi:MAG: hypothetical protein D6795_04975 [Deltaproteobacteria bacterium]|nr:MAG: hypothetical protein D6795_04975 [Deltaproteobacteria bacterium]